MARQTVRATLRRSVSAKRLPGDERMLRFDTPKNDKARTLEVDASTIEALRTMRERQIAEGVADVGAARLPPSHAERVPAVGAWT